MKNKKSSSLIYLLERTLRQTRGALQEEFDQKNAGLSVDQWIVLSTIAKHEKINQRTLAEHTAKDPASITRILHLLVEKKMVRRIQVPGDHRQFHLVLTPAGKKTERICERCVERFRTRAAKGLTQSDLNQQKEILDMLFENCGGKI